MTWIHSLTIFFLFTCGLAFPLGPEGWVNTTREPTSTDDLQAPFGKPFAIFQPKMFIVNSVRGEAIPWWRALNFGVTMSIPGLSPLYPTIRCTQDYAVCQTTTGEGSINAAASVMALGLSPLFDLSRTYFLLSGIARGEPKYTTVGSVTYAKYAVQVDVQHSAAYRDVQSSEPDWHSGFWPLGSDGPNNYPGRAFGTEVFEVNENLRNRAASLGGTATLQTGNSTIEDERQLYNETVAKEHPKVERCDTLTSNTNFLGNTLNDYFTSYAGFATNGSASFCSAAEEDNGSLEAFTRLHLYGLANFKRVVIQKSIYDFTRPPPSHDNDTVGWFRDKIYGGTALAAVNLPIAGLPFVRDVLRNWNQVYRSGRRYGPENYTGDILRSLGGTPDFGKPDFHV